MRAIRKILVAVKEPDARVLPAVDKAVQLARAFGASLELYHCITEKILADPYLEYFHYMEDFERRTEDRYSAALEALAAKLRAQGLDARARVDWDYPPHEALVRQAARHGSDLIVAECHAGKRKAAPWLLHLTDWELLKTSPVPVLLVKNATPWKQPVILAALDPAHARAQHAGLDAAILNAASTFSGTLHGSLEVVHSYVPIPASLLMGIGARGTPLREVAAESEKHAKSLLQDTLKSFGQTRIPRHVVQGKPTEAIPDIVHESGCALLVMGAVSRSGLKRVFIGNTAEQMLDLLPCDVLVVKGPSFKPTVSARGRGIRYVGLPSERVMH